MVWPFVSTVSICYIYGILFCQRNKLFDEHFFVVTNKKFGNVTVVSDTVQNNSIDDKSFIELKYHIPFSLHGHFLIYYQANHILCTIKNGLHWFSGQGML